MTIRSDSVYEFGAYRIDAARRRVTRDGEVVQLTPKCFEILIALVENKGEVFGKEDLISRVWPDSFVEEGNLTYNISVLRKALGERAGEHQYILTVPGHGYRFIADVNQVCKESGESEISGQPTSQPALRISRKRIAFIASSLIVFGVLAYWIVAHSSRMPELRSTDALKSIAVLPFELLGADNDSEAEYLSDGISESLINNLSQLPGVKVIARSSSFKYKGKAANPQEVANELGVEMILSGRVAQRGDILLISVELMNARDKTHVWGEQYTRKLSDLVSLQNEITRDVSQKFRRLSGAEPQKLAPNYSENVEAYQLYLKGRSHVLKLKPLETKKGISFYQQAIEMDSNNALAYVGLAEAYRALTLTGDAFNRVSSESESCGAKSDRS